MRRISTTKTNTAAAAGAATEGQSQAARKLALTLSVGVRFLATVAHEGMDIYDYLGFVRNKLIDEGVESGDAVLTTFCLAQIALRQLDNAPRRGDSSSASIDLYDLGIPPAALLKDVTSDAVGELMAMGTPADEAAEIALGVYTRVLSKFQVAT